MSEMTTDENGYFQYSRLKAPSRQGKPRSTGLTAIIDVGPSDFGWTGPRGSMTCLIMGLTYRLR